MKILATGKMFGAAGIVLGLVCGLLYSVGGFFVDLFATGLNRGTALAFMAIVGMPIMFGMAAFVLGAVVAVVVSGFRAVVDATKAR